jgi:UDPglucose--hexose-1-phosphate uridylyltransferase
LPEFRKDIILDEWVIIATERAKRPENFKEEKIKIQNQGSGICPFDKGNESMTPPEILRVGRQGNIVDAVSADWQIRVVPNKFPALIPNARPYSNKYGVYTVMDGFGLHEVVIHSPDHITNISGLDHFQIKMLVEVYLERLRTIKKDTRIESVIVMLNQGKEAGASLEHTHSQIFALPLTPPVLQRELYRTRSYFKQHNRCAVCDLLKFEMNENRRIVFENRHFIILQPFAARNPFETWIVPKFHHPNFEQITDEQVQSFAHCLKITVDFFYKELNEPPFNYYIHTGPTNSQEAYDHYHWNFELIPKLSIKAGFEIATGIDINITTPEDTAEFMKASNVFAIY